jgi:hypothetical protein
LKNSLESTPQRVRLEIEKGTKISNIQNPKSYLALTINALCIFVGVLPDKMPDVSSQDMLIDYINRYYKNLTLEELKLAFELGVAGQLQVDMNHYQNFSSLYFSSVINAYIEYRKRIVAQLNKEREEREAIPPKLSQEETYEINKKFDYNYILKVYQKFCKDGSVDFGHVPVGHIYNRLENELKIIKVTNERKQEIYQHVKELLPKKMKEKVASGALDKTLHDRIKNALAARDGRDMNSMIQDECRKIVITEMFISHKNQNLDIYKTLGVDKMWAEKYENSLKS